MCGHRHHHHRHQQHERHERPAATMPADDLRASDAEREAVIADLRAHAGEGRLALEELDERIERAYAARTRRELAALTGDLPRIRRPRPRREARAEFAEHLRTYVLVMALLVAIWALTGMGYFWPVWPALGWGIGLVSHAGAVRRPRTRTARTT
jgi:Domain of unknown function (DUF1707)/2TM domain